MSLVGWMLETSFGTRAKAQLSVALFNGDNEIKVDGYKRIPARRWSLSDRSASQTFTFGPYSGPTAYDRYVIMAGNERVDTFLEESLVTLPRGFVWEWRPELTFG